MFADQNSEHGRVDERGLGHVDNIGAVVDAQLLHPPAQLTGGGKVVLAPHHDHGHAAVLGNLDWSGLVHYPEDTGLTTRIAISSCGGPGP